MFAKLPAAELCIKPLSMGSSSFKMGEKTAYSPKPGFITTGHLVWWRSKGQNLGIHTCLNKLYHVKGAVKKGEVVTDGHKWCLHRKEIEGSRIKSQELTNEKTSLGAAAKTEPPVI